MTKSRQTDAKTSSLSSLISQIHRGFYAFHVFSQDPNGRRFALCQAALQALGQSKPQILKNVCINYIHTYIYTRYVFLFDGISCLILWMTGWLWTPRKAKYIPLSRLGAVSWSYSRRIRCTSCWLQPAWEYGSEFSAH